MKELLFAVKKDKGYTLEQLKKKSAPDLTVIAECMYTVLNSFAIAINEGLITISDYYFIPSKVEEEEIHIELERVSDSQEIVVNKELQIHINTNGGEGYNVDLYAYNNDKSDDKRDWDKEYIASTYASYAEIEEITKEDEVEE